jgi:hypothetical protein
VRKRRARLQVLVRPEPPTAVRKRRARMQVLVRPEPPTAVRKRRARMQVRRAEQPTRTALEKRRAQDRRAARGDRRVAQAVSRATAVRLPWARGIGTRSRSVARRKCRQSGDLPWDRSLPAIGPAGLVSCRSRASHRHRRTKLARDATHQIGRPQPGHRFPHRRRRRRSRHRGRGGSHRCTVHLLERSCTPPLPQGAWPGNGKRRRRERGPRRALRKRSSRSHTHRRRRSSPRGQRRSPPRGRWPGRRS